MNLERPNLIEGNMPDMFEQPKSVEMEVRRWYVPDVVGQYRMRREMKRITRTGKR